jgi:hypothetical protein
MAIPLIQMDATPRNRRWFPHLFTRREKGFRGAGNCFVVSTQQIVADPGGRLPVP